MHWIPAFVVVAMLALSAALDASFRAKSRRATALRPVLQVPELSDRHDGVNQREQQKDEESRHPRRVVQRLVGTGPVSVRATANLER